jgi:hypothetical protein
MAVSPFEMGAIDGACLAAAGETLRPQRAAFETHRPRTTGRREPIHPNLSLALHVGKKVQHVSRELLWVLEKREMAYLRLQ